MHAIAVIAMLVRMGNRWIIGAVVVVALVLPAVAGAFAPEFEHVYLEEAYSGWGLGSSVDADRESYTVLAGSQRLEAAFAITRDADGWISQTLLAPDRNQARDFAEDVAIDGDLIAIGAPLDDEFERNGGAVHLFERRGERWVATEILTAEGHDVPHGQRSANMGRTVAVDEGRVAAASVGYAWLPGAVYVWERVDGEWVSQQLQNPYDVRRTAFGFDIQIEGDLMAVSAPLANDAAGEAGAVYIYRQIEGVWELEAEILPDDPIENLEFGWAMSINDGSIAVGARGRFSKWGPFGRLYLLEQTEDGWTQTIIARDVPETPSFGGAVYFDGRHIYVNSFGWRDEVERPGVVYVYETSPGGWVLSETIPGDPDDHGFATSMGGDGDVVVFGSEPHSPRGDYSGEVSIAGIPEVTCAGQEPTLWGTREDDELVATIDPDVIFAGAGDDTISEVRADDIVCTGFGTDTVIVDEMPMLVDVSPQDHVIVDGFRQGAIALG